MEHPTRKRRWIVKNKKLVLKRETLRRLSGTDLQAVAGGTTVVVIFSAPTIVTTTTVTVATVTTFCARNTTDLAGR
jgi:hypothetical protein